MLVLSRKTNESIGIQVPGGPRITVTIVRCGGAIVNLGVDAPEEYEVNRAEVWEQIDAEAVRARADEAKDRRPETGGRESAACSLPSPA